MAKAASTPTSQQSIEQVAQQLNALLHAKHAPPAEVIPPAAKPLPPLEIGIHFGVPMARYRQDPALSASDMRRLLADPLIYWQHSPLNPARVEPPDSLAKMRGRAVHAAVLQPETFGKAYAAAPTPADFPGCLVLAEDMRNRCRELGLAVSGSKAELSKRIKAKQPDVLIFDELLAAFEAKCMGEGVEILPASLMAEVRQAAGGIKGNPSLRRAFEGGVSEVTVVWQEGDVRLKARLDYLKPKAICDLKTFTTRERPIDHAIRMSIAEYRLDLQARHYLDGYTALYGHAFDGRWYGDNPLPAGWGRKLAHPDDTRWCWVFHALDAPITKGREVGALSPVFNRATRELALAKATYADCLQRFGLKPWVDCEPIRELSQNELAAWMVETTEEATHV